VPRRVAPQPGEVIDRSHSVHFTWNDDPVAGFAGDTITSALMAAGTRVFSRSFKYHRPRGPMTASFWDPGCLVQVDREPNVRAGHRRLVEGMQVRAQSVWPSLGLDVKAANQAASRFLTAGFYYKTFMKPRRLWPVYERVLASFVPGGRLADGESSDYFDKRYVHVDVCVAGGGPAGMAAAAAAAEAGASVLLVEDEHDLGGHLRWGGEAEDVSSKDLMAAVDEGYSSVELVKRYTTVTMGSAQGKLETLNAVAVVSEALGQSIDQTGTTVWRPPYAPLTLGGLAGRKFEPVRYSPMQPWHAQHGAVPLVAGEWIRPDHYGDPHAEVRRVRSQVGIIDVTPLGKLELRGPDIPKLLNLLYVNKWSKLAVGAVRYGVMCGEDGVVIDDGVCGRLAPDHYFMSTTSSGASATWELIEYWLQVEHPDWDVIVTPMTDGYASINVAGPRSRQLLTRLVDGVDLDREAFGYMNLRQGRVAGVDGCYMWRIGFTGELSYELHVPAAYGLYVWEQLLSAGADLGCGPFGVEAQRIMRLEKGHFIVGQDTDGLTQGFGASLGWLIKLDKEDFSGKQELAWQLARDDYQRLVGLQPVDPEIVPEEGSQIVEGTTSVGRITSSRWSPTLARSICLGFVAPHLAPPGTTVSVKLPSGDHVMAKVTEHHAPFDPEGVRLRG
jgi:glycine cleavage system aminomethyltransferase T